MTGSAISGLAVTMSAADTRFTSIAIDSYGQPLCLGPYRVMAAHRDEESLH